MPLFLLRARALLGPEERQRILALVEDLPALWCAETTTQTERKQLLRFLIKDVTLTKRDRVIAIAIRWQTEACTVVDVPRPPRSCDARRTDAAVIARVRVLATSHTDEQIAAMLNEEGMTLGNEGEVHGVEDSVDPLCLRHRQWLPARSGTCEGQRSDGRYCTQAAAQLLNVNISTIVAWCKTGRLDGVQSAPHGPWWIKLTPEVIAQKRKVVRQQWKHRSSE